MLACVAGSTVYLAGALVSVDVLAESDRSERATSAHEKARAEAAVDELTAREENREMPLPGQHAHSNLILDKAKDHGKIDRVIQDLKASGKVKASGVKTAE